MTVGGQERRVKATHYDCGVGSESWSALGTRVRFTLVCSATEYTACDYSSVCCMLPELIPGLIT